MCRGNGEGSNLSTKSWMRALLNRASHGIGRIEGLLIVGLAYYVGAEAAFLVGTLSDKIFAPFWPPNVILLSALAYLPYRGWPLCILAVLPWHVIAELGVGMGWWQLSVAFVTNCSVAALSAFGLRYLLGSPPWLDSFPKAIVYVFVAAGISPAICALGGAFVRIAGGGAVAEYWRFWTEWFVGNALGSLTLGAAILAWSGNVGSVDLNSRARRVEALALLISLPVVCLIAFKTNFLTTGSHLPAFLYLPMPFVLWAAVRFGTRGASAAVLVVILASISAALDVPAVFISADAETNVLGFQLFLVTLSVPMLLLGAAIEDSRRAEKTALDLAQVVLGAHDHERRFVAHSLHDSIAQDLAAASFVVERIKGSKDRASVAQLESALRKSMADLRALSYQLHPPLLDSAGLEPALRTRIESYCQCTGIEVELEVADAVSRLPPDVELTIFRLVEDALANVKENPSSARARVSVTAPPDRAGIVLTIEDAMKGMPGIGALGKIQEILSTRAGPSWGLVRMRQRLQRIGGKLEVRSMSGGTFVRAIIPAPADR